MRIQICPEHRHELVGSSAIRSYLSGGRGVVTLESPTGVSHTYFYRRPDKHDMFPEDVIFVYALHNCESLHYVGMMENFKFRLTHNSKFLPDTEIVRGAQYIDKMMHKDMKTPMKLYHEGVCARCGRPLTNSKSVECGFGSRCKKHYELSK